MTLRVALYGRSGSGKSTVAQLLEHAHGCRHLKTGSACRAICRDLFDREDKTLLNQVTDALREIDPDVWLRAALLDVDIRDSQVDVVFDSMRFAEDYEFFRQLGFVTVRVEAPLEARVARLEARGQAFVPEVDNDHQAESELADAEFDFVITNGGDLDDLEARVDLLVSRFSD